MASKTVIVNKIKILITTGFQNPQEAFNFFDNNSDNKLSKKEIKRMVKRAGVNGFISGIVAKKMIKKLDKNKDKKLTWDEFTDVIDQLKV